MCRFGRSGRISMGKLQLAFTFEVLNSNKMCCPMEARRPLLK